jgi:hypothetical protein
VTICTAADAAAGGGTTTTTAAAAGMNSITATTCPIVGR